MYRKEERALMIRTHRFVSALGVAAALAAASPVFAADTFTFDKNHTLVGFRIRHFVS